MQTFVRRYFAFIFLVLLMSSLAWAQGGPTGAISGVVRDETGALVPNATVSITSVDTGREVRTLTSSAEGTFTASLLPVGMYRVIVTAPGFSRFEAANVQVRVTEVTSVPINLRVGAVETEVTVTEAATPVQLNSATTGQVISNVGAIPSPTRNVLHFLALSPGTSSEISDPTVLGRGTPSIEVNGQRASSNNYVLEGINANDFNLPQFTNVPVPNPSTVAEFKTQTSLYDASTGRNTGGNIQVALKSGTRDFHGDVFEFFRNEKLNANDFFLNRVPQLGRAPRPVLKQNVFGGSIGGPIIPERLFFFANYQGTRQRNGMAPGTQLNSLIVSLPEDRSAGSLASAFGVPAGSIHPVSLALLNLRGTHLGGSSFLIPSVPADVPGVHPRGRLILSQVGRFRDDQGVVNFDMPFSSSDRLSTRLFFSDNRKFEPFAAPLVGDRGLPQPRDTPGKNWFANLTETHIFGPRAVNDLRLGFNRFTFALLPVEMITLGSIGATRPNASTFPAAFQVNIASPGFVIGTGVNDDRGGAFNTYSITDTFSVNMGNHAVRVGGDVSHYQLNRFNRFATRGSVSFTAVGGMTAFQNFLLGNIRTTQGGAGFSDFFFRATDFSFFIQDDWKVTPRLTLNVGVRWEPFEIAHEQRNFITNLAGINDDRAAAFVFPEDLELRGLGTPGITRCTYADCRDWNNLAPRFGFAWDPTGNATWAVRGGYGIYYNRFSNQTLLQSTGGDVFSQAISGTGVPLQNPFPTQRPQSDFPLTPQPLAQLVSVGGGGLGAPTFTGPLRGFMFFGDRHLRTPYTQQWNFTIQRKIGANWVAETGYVGSKGTALLYNQALNLATLATTSNPVMQPLAGGGTATITGSTLDNIDARVPTKWLGIAAGRLTPVTNDGASTYHSWQSMLTRRFGNNYFQAAYTFGKSIDNTSGSQADLGDELNGNLMWNGNQRLSRGLSDFDRTHRAVLSFAYELPFFRDTGGLARALLGGWGVGGIITFQSGIPFTVYDSAGGTLQAIDFCCFATAQLLPGWRRSTIDKDGNIRNRLDEYFNTAAFGPSPTANAQGVIVDPDSAAAEGTLIGNSGRNILRGPFQQNWDFSLFKRFYVTETHNVELRGEFYNIWNHPVFAAPGCSSPGPCSAPAVDIQNGTSAGAIVSTANRPRVIQFALKYNF